MYEPGKGVNFRQAVRDLKQILTDSNQDYKMLKFNDIIITVSKDSNEDDIVVIYDLKHELRRLKK